MKKNKGSYEHFLAHFSPTTSNIVVLLSRLLWMKHTYCALVSSGESDDHLVAGWNGARAKLHLHSHTPLSLHHCVGWLPEPNSGHDIYWRNNTT